MIRELHDKLLRGEVSAASLTEEYLAKIDDDLGAYITVMREEALAQAALVDARIAEGEEIDLLAGVPGALKDNICVAGSLTTAGSKILENYRAPYSATVAERLYQKGGIVLGKTNMDEFACGGSTERSAFHVTKNPHDKSRVPGGSSGGSAAAVAAGEAVWALGTDTGGSIRQPASFCGVVGLKPTYGRVSRYGVIAMASSLDQVGPLAMSVEDVAIVLSRISGQDTRDATSAHSAHKEYADYLTGDLVGKKIGIPEEYLSDALDGRIRALFDAAIEKYREAGAEIVTVSLPHTEHALAAYYVIMQAEVSSNLARYDGIRYGLSDEGAHDSIDDYYKAVRDQGFGDEVKRRIMLGTYTLSAGYYDAYYKKAQKVRALIRQDFERVFDEVDVLFSPVVPEVAFPLGAKMDDPLTMYLTDIYSVTANLAGIPALSLPIGTVDEGGKKLPVGAQVMGKWFDEEGVLNAGHTLEKSLKH